jgi:hypothetical protein
LYGCGGPSYHKKQEAEYYNGTRVVFFFFC